MKHERAAPNPPKPKRMLENNLERDLSEGPGAPKSKPSRKSHFSKDEIAAVEAFSNSSIGTISPCKLEEVAKDINMWEKQGIKEEQVKEEAGLRG